MWKIFEGLNDWMIVKTTVRSNNGGDSKKVKSTILRKRQLHMSSLFKIRDAATYAINSKNNNGFYLVKWTSKPYVNQETDCLMCEGLWYDTANCCSNFYYVMNTEVNVKAW